MPKLDPKVLYHLIKRRPTKDFFYLFEQMNGDEYMFMLFTKECQGGLFTLECSSIKWYLDKWMKPVHRHENKVEIEDRILILPCMNPINFWFLSFQQL